MECSWTGGVGGRSDRGEMKKGDKIHERMIAYKISRDLKIENLTREERE